MKCTILLLISLMFISLTAQASDIYRWKDASGVVHYSDAADIDAKEIITKKISNKVTSSDKLSYETRRAQQNFPITLYVSTDCGEACQKARDLLNKRGIPFSEKVLRTKQEVDKFKKITGKEGVPTLAVGRTYLNGFLAGQWHGELDLAGYPKIAPYRAANTPSEKSATETEVEQ